MNWTYIGIAALLPLTVALGIALVAGAIQAIRSNREGGSSRVALRRFLRTLGLVFLAAFLLAALWDGRQVWRSLAGAALGRPADQRILGQLRVGGRHFLRRSPDKAAYWLRRAAEGGDAKAQLMLARLLLQAPGLARTPGEAPGWARAAADQGQPEAMVLMGDLLRREDPEGSDTWYRKALPAYHRQIEAGIGEASLSYGLMLTAGHGAAKDPVEGLAYMYLARRQGIDPFKQVIIALSEGPLTKPQRAEAAARSEALAKSLPREKPRQD
jgi:TPR repeat protein